MTQLSVDTPDMAQKTGGKANTGKMQKPLPRNHHRQANHQGEAKRLKALGLLGCLIWFAFLMAPFYWVFITAFKPPQAVNSGATYLPFIDFVPTLEAFREAFSGIRGDFLGPFWHSTSIALVSTFLSVLLGSMAAYGIARFTFRIRLLAGVLFALIGIGGFVILQEYAGLAIPQALLISLAVAVW